jgi:hypothetical protein
MPPGRGPGAKSGHFFRRFAIIPRRSVPVERLDPAERRRKKQSSAPGLAADGLFLLIDVSIPPPKSGGRPTSGDQPCCTSRPDNLETNDDVAKDEWTTSAPGSSTPGSTAIDRDRMESCQNSIAEKQF